MKNIFNRYSLLLLIPIFICVMYGCSSDTSDTNDTNIQIDATPTKELLTVKDSIEANLSEAMERLRYWDNSGLYENEFSYLTDETSLDEYLKFGQITYRNPSVVTKLLVDSLLMFAHDSAEVWVTITLEDQEGKSQTVSEQMVIAYYHHERWIKPTVSVIKHQADYDELIRQAEEAANWEDE